MEEAQSVEKNRLGYIGTGKIDLIFKGIPSNEELKIELLVL